MNYRELVKIKDKYGDYSNEFIIDGVDYFGSSVISATTRDDNRTYTTLKVNRLNFKSKDSMQFYNKKANTNTLKINKYVKLPIYNLLAFIPVLLVLHGFAMPSGSVMVEKHRMFMNTFTIIMSGIITFILSSLYSEIMSNIGVSRKINVVRDPITNYYTFDDSKKAQDIMNELNDCLRNKRSNDFKNIMNKLKNAEEEAKAEHDILKRQQQNELNAESLTRKLDNEFLSDVINNKTIEKVLQITPMDKLQHIFSADEFHKIQELNKTLSAYVHEWDKLSVYNRNIIRNSVREYTKQAQNITKLYDNNTVITEDLKKEFMHVVLSTNAMLSMVNNSLIEGTKDNISISNIFLEDKFPILKKEKVVESS